MTQKERLQWERHFAEAPDRLEVKPHAFAPVCRCAGMCITEQLCDYETRDPER